MKVLPLVLAVAVLASGCAAPSEPTPEPASVHAAALPAHDGAVPVQLRVFDPALRPVADALVHVQDDEVRTDADGLAVLSLPPGRYAALVDKGGYRPLETTLDVTQDPAPAVSLVLEPLPPDALNPRALAFRTHVACSLNVLVPFGHACALVDPSEAEGNWQFTMEPDDARRSTWRITYVAPEPGNYIVRVVTPESGAAGVGGTPIAELRINGTDVGELLLTHGTVGPFGQSPLDVTAGAKLVVFVQGTVASPEPLQDTPAGHGVGAQLDHRGDLIVQQWDPRGRVPGGYLDP